MAHYRATVLLIDDNLDLLAVVGTGLAEQYDYQVFTATDGAIGLDLAFTQQPDCIVIDVKMPGLNGTQLVRALRGDLATAAIPLIMLTAMAQDHDVLMGLLSGADQYLIKPQLPSAIHTAIARALTTSDAQRQIQMKELVGED